MNALQLDLDRFVQRLGAVVGDSYAPDLYELTIGALSSSLTTRAAVGRYLGRPDAVILSCVVGDFRDEDQIAVLDREVDRLRQGIPDELADALEVLDDARMIYADLALEGVEDARVDRFLEWVRLEVHR